MFSKTKAEPEGRGNPAELVDCRATVEKRELGATVKPKGQWAEAESGPRRLEAESRETPTMAMLEDGSPAELAPHRWWAEGEQRGCQTTAVGGGRSGWEGGHLPASRLPGLNLGTGGAGSGGRFRGAGTGALRGLNSGNGALSPMLWHNQRDILRSPSAVVQGAELLSALTPSAAFSLMAGVVAGSHTLTDIISSSSSPAILSSVAPYGDGSSVAILGQRGSAHDVQAGVVKRTERVVRVGGEACEDQEQSGVTLKRSLPLLQQEEEVFRAKEGIHREYRQQKQNTEEKGGNKNGGNTRR